MSLCECNPPVKLTFCRSTPLSKSCSCCDCIKLGCVILNAELMFAVCCCCPRKYVAEFNTMLYKWSCSKPPFADFLLQLSLYQVLNMRRMSTYDLVRRIPCNLRHDAYV